MKRLLVVATLLVLFVPSMAGAVDIYLLQYGYEEPCDGAQHGNMFNTVYCSKPPTFEVFGDLESAKKRLRESSPVKAFKIGCWTFSNSKPSCSTSEMEIVTDKDLREKASNDMEWTITSGTIATDNVITIIDPGGRRP